MMNSLFVLNAFRQNYSVINALQKEKDELEKGMERDIRLLQEMKQDNVELEKRICVLKNSYQETMRNQDELMIEVNLQENDLKLVHALKDELQRSLTAVNDGLQEMQQPENEPDIKACIRECEGLYDKLNNMKDSFAAESENSAKELDLLRANVSRLREKVKCTREAEIQDLATKDQQLSLEISDMNNKLVGLKESSLMKQEDIQLLPTISTHCSIEDVEKFMHATEHHASFNSQECKYSYNELASLMNELSELKRTTTLQDVDVLEEDEIKKIKEVQLILSKEKETLAKLKSITYTP